jgi:hypothetical protein
VGHVIGRHPTSSRTGGAPFAWLVDSTTTGVADTHVNIVELPAPSLPPALAIAKKGFA